MPVLSAVQGNLNVDDVSVPGATADQANSPGGEVVEGRYVDVSVRQQPRDPSLTWASSPTLRHHASRNRDLASLLLRAAEQPADPLIAALQREQRTGVQGESRTPGGTLHVSPSIRSAQA